MNSSYWRGNKNFNLKISPIGNVFIEFPCDFTLSSSHYDSQRHLATRKSWKNSSEMKTFSTKMNRKFLHYSCRKENILTLVSSTRDFDSCEWQILCWFKDFSEFKNNKKAERRKKLLSLKVFPLEVEGKLVKLFLTLCVCALEWNVVHHYGMNFLSLVSRSLDKISVFIIQFKAARISMNN